MNQFLKILGVFVTLVVVLNFSHCFEGKKFEDRVNQITKKLSSHLDLDEKQKVELERIKNQIIQKRKELKANKNPKQKEEFLEMVRADKMDLAKLNANTEARMKDKKEMMEFINSKIVEFHAILRPDQRKKLADKMEKFMKRHNDIN